MTILHPIDGLEWFKKLKGVKLKMQSDWSDLRIIVRIPKKNIRNRSKGVTRRQFRGPDSIIRDHTGWTNFTRFDSDDPRDRIRNPIQFIPGWIYLNDTEGGINLIRLIGYETYRATPTFRNASICIFADGSRLALTRLVFQILSLSSF